MVQIPFSLKKIIYAAVNWKNDWNFWTNLFQMNGSYCKFNNSFSSTVKNCNFLCSWLINQQRFKKGSRYQHRAVSLVGLFTFFSNYIHTWETCLVVIIISNISFGIRSNNWQFLIIFYCWWRNGSIFLGRGILIHRTTFTTNHVAGTRYWVQRHSFLWKSQRRTAITILPNSGSQ